MLTMIYANPKATVKPRLNKSLIEATKKLNEHGKQTPDSSLLLSHLSIDDKDGIPKRPKSSQSFSLKPINSKSRTRPTSKFKRDFFMRPAAVPDALAKHGKLVITLPAKRPIRVTKKLPKESEQVKKLPDQKKSIELVPKGNLK